MTYVSSISFGRFKIDTNGLSVGVEPDIITLNSEVMVPTDDEISIFYNPEGGWNDSGTDLNPGFATFSWGYSMFEPVGDLIIKEARIDGLLFYATIKNTHATEDRNLRIYVNLIKYANA